MNKEELFKFLEEENLTDITPQEAVMLRHRREAKDKYHEIDDKTLIFNMESEIENAALAVKNAQNDIEATNEMMGRRRQDVDELRKHGRYTSVEILKREYELRIE